MSELDAIGAGARRGAATSLVLGRRGVTWSSASPEAAAVLERAIDGFARHRAAVPTLLAEALALDPDLVGAHVLGGLAALLLGRRDLEDLARGSYRAALASIARRGATDRESMLVEALGAWTRGEPGEAAELLASALRVEPLDLLALKAHHAICFYLGRSDAMRAAIEGAVPAWRRADADGLGPVLGCLAFALTEVGEPARAADVAAAAAQLAEARGELDPWGKHAWVHALDALGRPDDALERVTTMDGELIGCSNFAGHVRWHEAVLRVERGELDRALTLHDDAIAIYPPRDFRDVVNASTLLYRLERAGLDVADRWTRVADVAIGRLGDHASPFADVHYALSLAGAARHDAATAFVASMERASLERADAAARLAREVGVEAARAVALAGIEPERALEALARIEPSLPRLGGSRAQRQIFRWVAAAARAARGGDA